MQTLVDYLRNHVPLTRKIDIRGGLQTDRWLELSAPLHPNLNDKQTAFGGSLATLCTLSGWCVVSMLCRELMQKVDIAVIDSQIRYRQPVTGDSIIARANFPSIEDQQIFIKTLQQKGGARLSLKARIKDGDITAVSFEAGYYVRCVE